MQEKEPQGDIGAGDTGTAGPARVLENPNRLVIGPEPKTLWVYANGLHTATLEGHFNTLQMLSTKPPFAGSIMDFERLRWTMTGALRRVQGEHVLELIGGTACVLRGKHRDVWHPLPGMDDVRLVVPINNPEGLQPLEVFQLAMRLGF
jgi:hypothetical protein